MWAVSDAFKRTLREEHQFATKVILLDTDFREVNDETIFSQAQTNEITNFISDGSIDVDSTRGTRRTAELTLLNPTSEWTPTTENFTAEGPWSGKLYLNRVLRIYRGVYIVGSPVYVPVGTFMIDNAEVIAERNMSLVVLTLSDMWKKLTKSYAAKNRKWFKGESYGAVIRSILEDTGSAFPLTPNIDDLSGRTNENKTLQKQLEIEEGDSRGDFLKERAKEWDIDVYFDPVGRFTMQDRKAARDKAVVWHFYSTPEQDEKAPKGMLQNLRRSFNDDNLYNHVVVVGGGESPVRRERLDNDPRSKLSIGKIGDRVWMLKDDKIKNGAQAEKALEQAWENRIQLSENITADVIANPALEADDVIRITEKEWVKVDGIYRLTRFTVPLISSRQTINCTSVLQVKRWEDI